MMQQSRSMAEALTAQWLNKPVGAEAAGLL